MPRRPGSGGAAQKDSIAGKHAAELAALINDRLGEPPDLIIRHLKLGGRRHILVYLEGLADVKFLSETLLETLIEDRAGRRAGGPPDTLPHPAVELRTGSADIITDLLAGKSILFRDRAPNALSLDTINPKGRNIEPPTTETVVRGPREAFVENIVDNVALVRQRLKIPRLRIRELTLGRFVKTTVNVLYIEGRVPPVILEQVFKRLNETPVQRVLGHGTISRLLNASRYPLFPTTMITERPDRVVAGLFEGRIAVLIDRTPFSVIVPSVFIEHLQSPEDYYENYVLQSAVRIIRYIMLHLAILAPALYVAITTYHQEMIPTSLLFSLVDQREVVPFPAVIEAILMGFVFEGLREAGVRLPRPVGQAVSIVGGIVLGEAAISAGLVSPAMIIVVGLTGIASFTTPSVSLDTPQLILRVVFLLGGAVLGLYGVIVIYLFALGHLLSLRSLGVPYFFPLAPAYAPGIADSVVVTPPEL